MKANIPFEQDQHLGLISAIIGLLVMIGVFAFGGLLALNQVAEKWKGGLAETVSIDLPPLLSLQQNEDSRAVRILTLALNEPGVSDASILHRDRMRELVKPWLGDAIEIDRLPLPVIIQLKIDRDNPPDFESFSRRLHQAVPGTKLNSFGEWRERLLRSVNTLMTVGIVILIAVALGIVSMILFLGFTSMMVYRQSIELLHLMGATDQYIAKQFNMLVAKISIIGASIGFGIACFLILIAGHVGLGQAYRLHEWVILPLTHWAFLSIIPIATFLLALMTVHFAVLYQLKKL